MPSLASQSPSRVRERAGVHLLILRVSLGVFFLFKAVGKMSWILDSSILSGRLELWLQQATAVNRWYIELVLPGADVLSRVVVVAELGTAAALLSGFWMQPVALAAFFMVLNFHVATAAIFEYSFLVDGSGLPVLGGLLALAFSVGRRRPGTPESDAGGAPGH